MRAVRLAVEVPGAPGDRDDELVLDRGPAGRQAVLEARAAEQSELA